MTLYSVYYGGDLAVVYFGFFTKLIDAKKNTINTYDRRYPLEHPV